MTDTEYSRQNLARIATRIAEIEARIVEMQERIRTLEARELNTEISHGLLAVLLEHLQIMEIRQRLAQDDIRRDQIVGKTGFQTEW